MANFWPDALKAMLETLGVPEREVENAEALLRKLNEDLTAAPDESSGATAMISLVALLPPEAVAALHARGPTLEPCCQCVAVLRRALSEKGEALYWELRDRDAARSLQAALWLCRFEVLHEALMAAQMSPAQMEAAAELQDLANCDASLAKAHLDNALAQGLDQLPEFPSLLLHVSLKHSSLRCCSTSDNYWRSRLQQDCRLPRLRNTILPHFLSWGRRSPQAALLVLGSLTEPMQSAVWLQELYAQVLPVAAQVQEPRSLLTQVTLVHAEGAAPPGFELLAGPELGAELYVDLSQDFEATFLQLRVTVHGLMKVPEGAHVTFFPPTGEALTTSLAVLGVLARHAGGAVRLHFALPLLAEVREASDGLRKLLPQDWVSVPHLIHACSPSAGRTSPWVECLQVTKALLMLDAHPAPQAVSFKSWLRVATCCVWSSTAEELNHQLAEPRPNEQLQEAFRGLVGAFLLCAMDAAQGEDLLQWLNSGTKAVTEWLSRREQQPESLVGVNWLRVESRSLGLLDMPQRWPGERQQCKRLLVRFRLAPELRERAASWALPPQRNLHEEAVDPDEAEPEANPNEGAPLPEPAAFSLLHMKVLPAVTPLRALYSIACDFAQQPYVTVSFDVHGRPGARAIPLDLRACNQRLLMQALSSQPLGPVLDLHVGSHDPAPDPVLRFELMAASIFGEGYALNSSTLELDLSKSLVPDVTREGTLVVAPKLLLPYSMTDMEIASVWLFGPVKKVTALKTWKEPELRRVLQAYARVGTGMAFLLRLQVASLAAELQTSPLTVALAAGRLTPRAVEAAAEVLGLSPACLLEGLQRLTPHAVASMAAALGTSSTKFTDALLQLTAAADPLAPELGPSFSKVTEALRQLAPEGLESIAAELCVDPAALRETLEQLARQQHLEELANRLPEALCRLAGGAGRRPEEFNRGLDQAAQVLTPNAQQENAHLAPAAPAAQLALDAPLAEAAAQHNAPDAPLAAPAARPEVGCEATVSQVVSSSLLARTQTSLRIVTEQTSTRYVVQGGMRVGKEMLSKVPKENDVQCLSDWLARQVGVVETTACTKGPCTFTTVSPATSAPTITSPVKLPPQPQPVSMDFKRPTGKLQEALAEKQNAELLRDKTLTTTETLRGPSVKGAGQAAAVAGAVSVGFHLYDHFSGNSQMSFLDRAQAVAMDAGQGALYQTLSASLELSLTVGSKCAPGALQSCCATLLSEVWLGPVCQLGVGGLLGVYALCRAKTDEETRAAKMSLMTTAASAGLSGLAGYGAVSLGLTASVGLVCGGLVIPCFFLISALYSKVKQSEAAAAEEAAQRELVRMQALLLFGLRSDYSIEDVQRRFRVLSRYTHSDRIREAGEDFRKVSWARDVLLESHRSRPTTSENFARWWAGFQDLFQRHYERIFQGQREENLAVVAVAP